MPITIDLGALFEAQEALRRIASLDLPPRVAYHVMKLMRLTADDARHFAAEREKLFRTHGKEQPRTQEEIDKNVQPTIRVDPSDAEFFRLFNELGKIQVTVQWAPLTLDELGDAKIRAADLLALDDLFDDSETEKKND